MSTTTPKFGFTKPELTDAADITAFNDNWDKVDEALSTSNEPVVAISSDGISYTAEVPNVTELYNGLTITVIPNKRGVQAQVDLNVNGLGAKPIRQPINSNSVATKVHDVTSWFVNNSPVRLMYDGDYWKTIDIPATSSSFLYGTVPMSKGGTGSSTLANAPLGAIIMKEIAQPSTGLDYVSTNNGALYATAENGKAQFGTLPIAQGGTGATTKANALTNLGAASKDHYHKEIEAQGNIRLYSNNTQADFESQLKTILCEMTKSPFRARFRSILVSVSGNDSLIIPSTETATLLLNVAFIGSGKWDIHIMGFSKSRIFTCYVKEYDVYNDSTLSNFTFTWYKHDITMEQFSS